MSLSEFDETSINKFINDLESAGSFLGAMEAEASSGVEAILTRLKEYVDLIEVWNTSLAESSIPFEVRYYMIAVTLKQLAHQITEIVGGIDANRKVSIDPESAVETLDLIRQLYQGKGK